MILRNSIKSLTYTFAKNFNTMRKCSKYIKILIANVLILKNICYIFPIIYMYIYKYIYIVMILQNKHKQVSLDGRIIGNIYFLHYALNIFQTSYNGHSILFIKIKHFYGKKMQYCQNMSSLV